MKQTLLPALALLLTTACNYNHMKEADKAGSRAISEKDLAAPEYQTVAALLNAKCLSCHSKVIGKVEGSVSLDNYMEVRDRLNRIADRALERKDMPPKTPLTALEGQLLRTWIDTGAPEKIVGIGEKPDPSLDKGPNDWAKISGKIFARKCNDCHGKVNPAAGLDLTEIEKVRGKAPEIFDRVIVRQDMPIPPYRALTPKERRILFQWFDSGMPR